MNSKAHIQSNSSANSTGSTVTERAPYFSEESAQENLKYYLPIQCKLTVGAVDDPLEHQADAMADQVMRMPEQTFIQRKCTHCEEEEKVQRKSPGSFVQRKESTNETGAGDAVSEKINSTRGNGHGIGAAKSFMENSFGTDFSSVSIHTDSDAVQMNRELNAKAFTVGNDIYFNEGQYQPVTSEGKQLLAHELTHVVQQTGMIRRKTPGSAATTAPAPMTMAQFKQTMINVYGFAKVKEGTMAEQITSMRLSSGQASLQDWHPWSPDAQPEIYQYIVDAYAEFNQVFGGFSKASKLFFFDVAYDADTLAKNSKVVAEFGADELLIYSSINAPSKVLPTTRSAAAIAPMAPVTLKESTARYIFHELAHGLNDAAMSGSPAADPDMLQEYNKTIGRYPFQGGDRLYDIGVPAVESAIKAGTQPSELHEITKYNWNRGFLVEQPISDYMVYGGAGDDFAEAVMAFVANPALLKARSPRRYNFLDTRRTKWVSRLSTPSSSSSSSPGKKTAPGSAPSILQKTPDAAGSSGLSTEELNRIALQLHKAMAGWGTDEDSIYSALSGRTQEQVDAITRVYQSLYGHPLLADLQDELTEEEMQHLAIFSPTAIEKNKNTAEARADLVAVQLRNAMTGWGTNEESIMAVLTGRSEAERQEIKKAYKRLTNHELEADLSDELSGYELERALKLLNHGILTPEEEGFWGKLWKEIKSVAGLVWSEIKSAAGWLWDVIKSAGAWIWDLITWLPSRLWSLMKHIGSGIAGIARWLWGLVHVIMGDIGLSEWFVNGLLGGLAWGLKLVAKIGDVLGIGELWTFINNIIKRNTRTLTDTEKQEAQKVFGNSISYWQVRVDEKSIIASLGAYFKGGGGMGVTTAHTINFNKKISATPGSNDMHWLIHELSHVAQYTKVGIQYIGEAVHAQATGGYDYKGGPGLAGKNLNDFNREQQASIIADYYCCVLYGGSTCCPVTWSNSFIVDYTRMRDQAVNGMF